MNLELVVHNAVKINRLKLIETSAIKDVVAYEQIWEPHSSSSLFFSPFFNHKKVVQAISPGEWNKTMEKVLEVFVFLKITF